jgi:FKBP-type peptidyl-prolyl cis-trans isomerase 2
MTDTIIEKNKYVSFTYRILDENENIVEQSNVPKSANKSESH